MSTNLTAERLRELLDYSPETGLFRWLPRDGDKWFNSRFANKIAGTTNRCGYISINVDGHRCLAHRLAWLHYYGTWPKFLIDHRDRNTSNNAIVNLSDVPPAINNQNRKQRIGESGFKGVQRAGNKWIATTDYRSKRVIFGVFGTIEEAVTAYNVGMSNIEDTYLKLRYRNVPLRLQSVYKPLSSDELRRRIYYDPDTGQFFKRTRKGLSMRELGHVDRYGYRRIRVGGKRFPSHVLAVFYMTGQWSTGPVDHINGIRSDNRWCNLREATHSINALNRACGASRGIRPTRNKITRWEARIKLDGTEHHLGTFDTEEEARDVWTAFVQEQGLAAIIR